MSKLYALIVMISVAILPLKAQEYTISLEEHSTTLIAGMTTYRLYVNMVNSNDFLSSIYGGDVEPLSITTTTGFYNDAFGASVASGINPAFIAFFPTIAGDSWVTIGIDSQNTGSEVPISTVESPDQPWTPCFASGSPQDGQDVIMNDATGGAWYVLNGSPNGLPDENMQVLVMQMTTAGEICGTMNFQIFVNGDGQNGDTRLTYTFCGVGTYSPDLEGGCMDEAACNYDSAAAADDGSCIYAETGYDCDGNCLEDSDGDGICDAFEVAGCTDIYACNYEAGATDDDGSCEYLSCAGCTDPDACNYDPNAIYPDGSCDYISCGTPGCTVAAACNYNPEATYEDGTCEYESCVGCTDMAACNYDPAYTLDNGSCDYSCIGCTDSMACNYDMNATQDDGSCEFPIAGYDCNGECINDADGDDVCDEYEVAGCTDMMACNYNELATDDDGMCTYAEQYYDCSGNCLMDMDGDGVCDDLEVPGCADEMACNFDESATDDDGSCEFPEANYDCDGNCVNDADMDGICDEFEIAGCMDMAACNYDEAATDDNGSCDFPIDLYGVDYVDCEGTCLNDADMDGICDEAEIAGCTDPEAANYNADATEDDGSCYYCDAELAFVVTDELEGNQAGAIDVTVTGGTAPFTFAWTGPDGFTSSEEDLGGLSAGVYSLTIEDANGCVLTAEIEVEALVGIAELNALNFTVYPNPSNGTVWLQVTDWSGLTSVELFDATGRRVFDRLLNLSTGANQVQLGEVATGMYHLVLSNDAQRGMTRLLIH